MFISIQEEKMHMARYQRIDFLRDFVAHLRYSSKNLERALQLPAKKDETFSLNEYDVLRTFLKSTLLAANCTKKCTEKWKRACYSLGLAPICMQVI